MVFSLNEPKSTTIRLERGIASLHTKIDLWAYRARAEQNFPRRASHKMSPHALAVQLNWTLAVLKRVVTLCLMAFGRGYIRFTASKKPNLEKGLFLHFNCYSVRCVFAMKRRKTKRGTQKRTLLQMKSMRLSKFENDRLSRLAAVVGSERHCHSLYWKKKKQEDNSRLSSQLKSWVPELAMALKYIPRVGPLINSKLAN